MCVCVFTYEAGYAKNPSHRPDIRAVLAHGPNGHLSGGPTSIGVHANLCMLNTLPSPGAHSAIKTALPDIITITLVHTCMLLSCAREREKGERNVLFNDALNTFYLRLYGVRHMVKDHSDSGKGNPLPPHRLLFPINSKGSFICTIPQTG